MAPLDRLKLRCPHFDQQKNHIMTKRKLLTATCLVALVTICLPAEKLSAQADFANRYSTAIDMMVNGDTAGIKTSHFGIMEPIGLLPDEQITITLIVSSNWANYPVGIAPLDGGEIFAPASLSVASNGTVNFNFKGESTPGHYRVLVTIASEQYELRLYAATSRDVNCPPPP